MAIRTRTLTLLTVLAACRALVACDGTSGDAATGAAAPEAGPSPAGASGADASARADSSSADVDAAPADAGPPSLPPCARPASAGRSTLTVAVSGGARTAVQIVPPAYDGHTRVPVVLLFHGSGGGSDGILTDSAFAATAAAHGALLVAPQATLKSDAGGGPFWNIPGVPLTDGSPVPAGAPSDVDFVRALLDALGSAFCVDPARVYVAGFSGGARFASTLACTLADRVAAVATASGLRSPDGCTAAMPVVAFHALDDGVNAYDGGPPPVYWTYGVEEAAARWATRNGCPRAPSVMDQGSGQTLKTWTPCAASADVALHVRATGGHAWPSPASTANEQIWSFFATHPRR